MSSVGARAPYRVNQPLRAGTTPDYQEEERRPWM